jgi:hypothetical protein
MDMRRSFQVLFASALLMLSVAAFASSSASASTTEECKEPVAGEEFTSAHFLDPNCEKQNGAEGEFHTTLIPGSSILVRTATLPFPVKATLLGTAFEAKCSTYGGETTVSNFVEKEKHKFKGEGKIKLSGCVVSKPSGCTMEPIETVQLSETSEDLEKAQRTLFAPVSGTKLATLTIKGCAIAGVYAIEGKLRSQTLNIHSEEFSSTSGSELKIGGNVFVLEGLYHNATKANGKTIVRELP